MIPKISLEQWAVFRAVVEEGSFANAAERLNKSQSSISYIISRMEERLPTPALTIVGRKAQLTDAGIVLYRQACSLLDQANLIDRSAEYIASGWESELSIIVDSLIPLNKVFCALQTFSERSPNTRIRVLETTLSGTDEAIIERKAHLALVAAIPTGFLGLPLWRVKMIPVVSAEHHLAQVSDGVSEAQLIQQRQIVLRDSGSRREQNAGWLMSEQRWTVSHFSSSIEALKAGLGFAFLPDDWIKKELASGELVQIKTQFEWSRELTIHLVVIDRAHAGPATNALANEIKAFALKHHDQ